MSPTSIADAVRAIVLDHTTERRIAEEDRTGPLQPELLSNQEIIDQLDQRHPGIFTTIEHAASASAQEDQTHIALKEEYVMKFYALL